MNFFPYTMRRLATIISFFTILAFLWNDPAIVRAQNRGVRVNVTDEQGNAAEKQLYEASYALVIGAADYKSSAWANLEGVRNDVKDVEKTLTKQGFAVETLLNPTSLNLNSTIRQFINKYGLRPENRLLIYYAGHGYTETDGSGIKRGYIVPVDAPSPEKEPDDFYARATTMDDIENFARNIRSKHVLFVFDSCFSGTLISRDSLSVTKYISYITEKPVRQFITAGAANQTVPDESIFRRMFVKSLDANDPDNADKNKDGYVTGTELALYLQEKVIYYRGSAQTPQYGKLRDPRFDQGDFVFKLSASPAISDSSAVSNSSAIRSRASALAEQALNRMMIADFNEAEKLANEALDIDADSALAYGIRGWISSFRTDLESSKKDLEKAVRLDSGNALLLVRLANTYRNLKQGDLAKQTANRALQKLSAPATAIEFYAKGLSYDILENIDYSIDFYTSAIKLNPRFVLAYNNRGISYYDKQDYEAAIRDYSKAVELDPKFASAYNNRGISYNYKKEYDAAIRDFTKAIELDPKDSSAYYNRGNSYANKKDYEAAIRDYSKAVELNPKNALTYYNRGISYYDKQEYDAAIRDFTKAIELDPKDASAYRNRAIVYDKKGETEKAAADRRKAEELENN